VGTGRRATATRGSGAGGEGWGRRTSRGGIGPGLLGLLARGGIGPGLLGLVALACAGPVASPTVEATGPSGLEAALADLPAVPTAELRIALAFGAGADLDLSVRDPADQLVDYAHPRSDSGLHFATDRLCGDPSPRVERVRASARRPGAYRVGIVHRATCATPPPIEPDRTRDAGTPATDWVLRIDDGPHTEWRRGRIAPGGFALESFTLDATHPDPVREVGSPIDGTAGTTANSDARFSSP